MGWVALQHTMLTICDHTTCACHHPNFTSTYHGLMPVEHSVLINSVLKVRTLVGAFSEIMNLPVDFRLKLVILPGPREHVGGIDRVLGCLLLLRGRGLLLLGLAVHWRLLAERHDQDLHQAWDYDTQ